MRALAVASVWLAACATPSASVAPVADAPASTPAPPSDACPKTVPSWADGPVPAGATVARVCLVGAHEDDFLRLNEIVAPREGTRLEPDGVREDIEDLMKAGYVKDVVVVAEPLDAGRVKLVYAVTPHDRVGEVRLEGVKALTLDDVDEVAKVGLPASGVMLRAVRGAFAKVYELHGYPRAVVDVRLEPTRPGFQTLVLSAKEGPRLALGAITFAGARKVPAAELKKALKSAVGDVYSADTVERDALALTGVYYDFGHVNARVNPEPPREVNGALDLTFTIEEGDVFRVGALKLKGDALGAQKPVLAALKSKPGAVFSRSAVREDLERLKALGRKRGVALEITPLTEVNSDARRIDLTFELSPAR